ncbi:MAG: DUF4038 domain-containing protein [Promicromonosporaceae bacterium]|nr:DUF4038 domain-containing protein [Promicromonosporaceae bacterium]
MKTVELYDIFELRFPASKTPLAVFANEEVRKEIYGFQVSDDEYAIRFMPEMIGTWHYSVGDLTGELVVTPNTGGNHGKVVAVGCRFEYADGGRYIPVGTTCYAWTHQSPELIKQTLATLADSPFNKVRMCLFPKSMPYNRNDPERYPFLSDAEGSWDVTRPDFLFWEEFEANIAQLRDLGIEADLILFHPYDRWGFSKLTREQNLAYLDYAIRRLAAYRNIWWAIANEYDFILTKDNDDWDAFGERLQAADPYGHLISNHNGITPYPKRDWLTHCSIQTKDMVRSKYWRTSYELPIIMEEFGYEGDIEYEWGNITAFELVSRAWQAVVNGAYPTHGETYWREDEVLWWAKGGVLHGESPQRLAFLKNLLYEIGDLSAGIRSSVGQAPNGSSEESQANNDAAWFMQVMGKLSPAERINAMLNMIPPTATNENHALQYFGRSRPCFKELHLPESGTYRVEIIDAWEMTRDIALPEASGTHRLPLPAKEGIALLVTRLTGAPITHI